MQEVERPNVRRGKQVQVSKTPEAMTQKQVDLDHSGRKVIIHQVCVFMYDHLPDGSHVLLGRKLTDSAKVKVLV